MAESIKPRTSPQAESGVDKSFVDNSPEAVADNNETHEREPSKQQILAEELMAKQLEDIFEGKSDEVVDAMKNSEVFQETRDNLAKEIMQALAEANNARDPDGNKTRLEGKARTKFIEEYMQSAVKRVNLEGSEDSLREQLKRLEIESSQENQPNDPSEHYPSTEDLNETTNPTKLNIFKRGLLAVQLAVHHRDPSFIFGNISKKLRTETVRSEDESEEDYEKRLKRQKIKRNIARTAFAGVAIGAGLFAINHMTKNGGDTGAVERFFDNMDLPKFGDNSEVIESNFGADASGGGVLSTGAPEIMSGGDYLSLFDGYEPSEDVFNMAGKIGENDWRAPLEGVDAAEKGQDFLNGLRTSPSQLSTTISELGLLPDDYTQESLQKLLTENPDEAKNIINDIFQGNTIEFKQSADIPAGEAYGSFYGVESADGIVQMSYDELVEGKDQASKVIEMVVTEPDGSQSMIEIREECGQIIKRFADGTAEAVYNNIAQGGAEQTNYTQPVGGGEISQVIINQGTQPIGGGDVPNVPIGGGETPPPSHDIPPGGDIPPSGGGENPPPETPPIGGGEVPPPVIPPTPETPPNIPEVPPTIPETPIPDNPTPEVPINNDAKQWDAIPAQDYVTPDYQLYESTGDPAVVGNGTASQNYDPGINTLNSEVVDATAIDATVGTGGDYTDQGVTGYGEQGYDGAAAAAADLNQSYDSAQSAATVESGATTAGNL